MTIDDIDFHINNQRILNYLNNKGLEKYISLIENVGNQLLIGSTLQDRVYCTNYNTKNLTDKDVSSIDEVIANTKDISQIDRLFVLMREVVLEN